MSTTISKIVLGLAVFAGGALRAQPPLGTLPIWTTSEQNMYCSGMIWRDCNNDGVVDAFFSNGNDIVQAQNSIYLFGDGPPPSAASWYSANSEYSGHCAVGDINDDGFPDFVVSNFLGSDFQVPNRSDLYLNQGGLPDPVPAWRTPDSILSFSCALGDYDNDGDLDIVFGTGEAYYLDAQQDLIYRNDGGSFSDTAVWRSDAMTLTHDATWGDVDNDGDLDLAFAYCKGLATSLFYNDGGSIPTTPSWQAASLESANTLVFGDINGDGWLDLIVAYNVMTVGKAYYRAYFNDGAGHLNPNHGWEAPNGGYGSALALYDYDKDGDDDLAAGRWWDRVRIYENTGSTFTSAPVWESAIQIVSEELAWVDIDGLGVLTFADTLWPSGERSLYYTQRHPLYAIDSVIADQVKLGASDFCYDLVSGWVSLAQPPQTQLIIHHRYSFKNDLASANWDTVNMVFGNTSPPSVDISADITFGPAPLAVQFTDRSEGAQSWLWDFGDGATAEEQNPTHVFEAGYYDVGLTITASGRTLARTFPGLVSAYADTLRMSESRITSRLAKVDVYTHNHLPLGEMRIPFSWAGPLQLRFDSATTAGTRAEYFDVVEVLSFVSQWKVADVRVAAGAQPYLEPGDGPVVSLWFTDSAVASVGTNPIAFTSFSGRTLTLTTQAGVYRPASIDGQVYALCCQGVVGDVNGIDGDDPTIGDISALIDHLFMSGVALPCLGEADVNLSGGLDPLHSDITVGDISSLIDHLFISGTLPPSCP